MEIPTDKIDNELDNLADTLLGDVSQPATRIKTVLDAREVIKAQALEIRELQAVIVRMREASDALNRVFLEADSNNSTLNCWIHENNKMEGV